ncbi:MAG TPA: glycoside hydrolase family 2 TIM barrel-domain containing protein, partial [Candidatus Lokiarchaeia archaeon]|nr:glycoside hydrolase family 2 TIM barrel-domain containing protein [Candidatus Lokiarchaeia archaeon]
MVQYSPQVLSEVPARLDLSGQWKFKVDETGAGFEQKIWELSYDDADWEVMPVPSNWYVAVGLDYAGKVWFRKEFALPAALDPNQRQRAWLLFHGVDYIATAWVNGTRVGSHVGYFSRFAFDVTRALENGEGQDNVACVLVDAPRDPGFPNKKQQFKGGLVHWDCRPGGWTSKGQERGSGGIWLPVEVKVTGPARIAEKRLSARFNPDLRSSPAEAEGEWEGDAEVKVAVKVDTAAGGAPIAFHVKMHPINFDGTEIDFWEYRPAEIRRKVFSNHFVRESEFTFGVRSPGLWWTWDAGFPRLYACELSLHCSDTLEGPWQQSDVVEFNFGFRDIREVAAGWLLNGHRIFLRGTNYFSSLWLGEMDEEKFKNDTSLLLGANMNFVRVSYHVDHPLFYEACDANGILVLQDFPTLWDYQVNPKMLRVAMRQMRDMVIRLHDHACIAAFSCFTEPSSAINKHMAAEMRRIGLRADLQTRKIYAFTSHQDHPFAGWYWGSKYCYLLGPAAPFPSEFGPQSLPNTDSPAWEILDVRANWPPNAKWAFHNFQFPINYYLAGNLPFLGWRGMVRHSQHFQANNLKFGIEAFRRLKGKIHALALFTFCDAWPGGMGWSIVDYFRREKEAYSSVRSAYAPVMVSITPRCPCVPYKPIPVLIVDLGTLVFGPAAAFFWSNAVRPGGSLHLDFWVVNDYAEPVPAHLTVTLQEEKNNRIIVEDAREILIPADTACVALAMTLHVFASFPLGR